MEKDLIFPTAEKVVEYNRMALSLIYASKGDRPQLLSKEKLEKSIAECRESPGDVYDKAAVLLEKLVRAHAFASGNRRTAFLSMKAFLSSNGHPVGIADQPENAIPLRGIREGFYSHDEIKEWIVHGKIRPHQR